MDGLTQWKCGNGHVLGVVQRVHVDGYHVSRLMLFRHAIDPNEERMRDVDVIATVEGMTQDVHCDACGLKRTWYMGEDVVRKVVGLYVAE